MTVDELIKLWREYRAECISPSYTLRDGRSARVYNTELSFDDFINWLERRGR